MKKSPTESLNFWEIINFEYSRADYCLACL